MTEINNQSPALVCPQCNHAMAIHRNKKFSARWATTLIVVGALCCLFVVGAAVGLPLLLVGIYMATAEETIRLCSNCGYFFKVVADKRESS
ncbi:MAG: hypothetical protein HQK55_11065 [Deltaproteobacteria bacterium]|nr:hypothetical protein [Deltaproteobacteria bacterium]